MKIYRVAIFCLLLVSAVCCAHACPSCADAVAGQKSHGLADGLNYSIIGLMGMPFLVAGGIGGAIYRALRKQR
jgi:hypothetical protein